MRGKAGPKGEKGEVGSCRCELQSRLERLETELASAKKKIDQLGGTSQSCLEILERRPWSSSGVYYIYLNGDNSNKTKVFCDMDTDGGGWTVFQRRQDGSVGFFLGWSDYKMGFGDVNHEFWMGLDLLRDQTKNGSFELRVDLKDWDDNAVYAHYSSFSIGEGPGFTLNVAGYSGTAGDGLKYHNGMNFSTYDNNQDVHADPNYNCANVYQGAFWYRSCHHVNLNGVYYTGDTAPAAPYGKGVNWYEWKAHRYSLKFSEMKFRAK